MILGIVKCSEGLIWVLGTSSSKLFDTPLDECSQKKSLVTHYMIIAAMSLSLDGVRDEW